MSAALRSPRWEKRPGPEVTKLFSCSTELSMKFQMLISIKYQSIRLFKGSDKPRMPFFPLNANDCWHCNIYEQEKFHDQLSGA